jgi:magnesium transporter
VEARDHLATRYATDYPEDAARRLDAVPADRTARFLADLDPEIAARVIDGMLPSTAAAALGRMAPDGQAAILGRLSAARCVSVLRSVDTVARAGMVSRLPKELSLTVERLLRAPEGSAGALAGPVTAVLAPRTTVAEARDLIADLPGSYAYVVDEDRKLIGVVHRRDLAASRDEAPVESLMSRQVVRLPATAPHWAVRGHPAWADFDALPVVDGSDTLVGVLRHRSLRRLGVERPSSIASGRPALGAFLELGELYWGGLSSLLSGMAGRDAQGEVDDGS